VVERRYQESSSSSAQKIIRTFFIKHSSELSITNRATQVQDYPAYVMGICVNVCLFLLNLSRTIYKFLSDSDTAAIIAISLFALYLELMSIYHTISYDTMYVTFMHDINISTLRDAVVEILKLYMNEH
jgi:hypothetical protein